MAGVTHRLSRLTRVAWSGAVLGIFPLANTGLTAETVQSLRYGASLYYFYQQDYFNALTELMAGQQLDLLGPHTGGAEMLRGGMALSYGMDRLATGIFQQQLATNPDSVNADQAWFYLGKMAWQRGNTQGTLQSLARMTPDYTGPLKQQANYLRASAQLRQGEHEAAARQWRAMPEDSPWRRHLGYNLGASHAARQDWAGANHYFDSITQSAPASPEAYALYDKAHTAAGYTHLSRGAFEQSSQAFRQVRLSGPYTTRALLGYGWSAAEQDDFLTALSPWQQLSQHSMLDESARESLLAVPYAYDQLGRADMALRQYQFASAQYTEELASLEQAIITFRDKPLAPLLGLAEQDGADWLFDLDILPDSDQTPYLQHLVSTHSFQVALRELRDLYSVAGHLERAGQRLRVLQEVDAHQQQVWAKLEKEDRRTKLARLQQQLTARQRVLEQNLLAAIAQGDGRQLASREQAARWSRLESAALAASKSNNADEFRHRLRMLRGLLIWDDNEAFPMRAWQTRENIRELQQLAAESGAALQQVDAAIAARSESDFAPRIAQLTAQVEVQAHTVQSTIGHSETQLRQVAIAELEQQAGQLARALGQSQLAIAHIQDQAMAGASYE